MPTQPVPLNVGAYSNDPPALDAASIALADLDGATWIDSAKRPCGGWSVGPDGIPTVAGLGGIFLGNVDRVWDFGSFMVDAPGNADGTIRIALRVKPNDSRWKYTASIGGVTYDLAAPTGTEAWFTSDPIPLPNGNAGQGVEVQVGAIINNPASTEGHVLKAICILADTDSSAPDWHVVSPRCIDADSPDDAHFIRTSSDQLANIVNRFPRILATHSFGDASSDGTDTNSEHHYLVQAGPQTSSFDIWVYAKAVDGELMQIRAYYDGVQQLDYTISSASFAWINIGSLTVSEAGRKPLLIQGIGAFPDYEPGTVTIKRICILENAHDPANVLASDGDRTDPVPQSFIRPDLSVMQPGCPIVATSFQSSEPQSFVDRTTALHNRAFEAIYRTMNVVTDHLFDANEDLSSTQAAAFATLATWKHQVTRGAVALRTKVRVQRLGIADQAHIRVRAKAGSVTGDFIEFTFPSGTSAAWVDLPDVTLTDDGSVVDCSVEGGWVNRWGTATSVPNDTLQLQGIAFREVGSTSGRAYAYASESPAAVVATGTSGTRTFTVANSFPVRHVRVKCTVSGTTSTLVIIALTNPNGDSVILKGSGNPFPSGWHSDDEIDDSDPVFPLSGLATGDASGDWTLTVNNASGQPVTIDEFAIEIR